MRMWNVEPKLMCNKHLLGEHVELHMLVGSIRKHKNLDGFIDGGLVELHNIQSRHQQLVDEMHRRGYKHKSPLPHFTSTPSGEVDPDQNLIELCRRCEACRGRIQEVKRV